MKPYTCIGVLLRCQSTELCIFQMWRIKPAKSGLTASIDFSFEMEGSSQH